MRTIGAVVLFCLSTAVAQVPGAWTAVPSTTHPFFGFGRWSGTFDSLRGESVFVYADTLPGVNAVRTWNGTTWATIATASPNLQWLTSIAHDPVRDRLVVSRQPGQMYEWDRVTWTPIGASPFTQEAHLCWDPARLRVITVVDSGIHEWDGTAWTLVPGTALPYSFPNGLRFTVDRARNAIVGVGAATGVNQYVTVEWTGASWSTYVTTGSTYGSPTGLALRVVDAPALGGVVGYQITGSLTRRWNPTTHEWDVPGFGGSPGSFHDLELAYDDLRGRLAMSNAASLSEYDTSLVYTPRTFHVDPVGSAGYYSLEDALDEAVDGDRIVVAAGGYGPGDITIRVAVRVECHPTAHMESIRLRWLTPDREVSWTGGIVPVVVGESTTGRFRLKGATVTSQVRALSSMPMALEGCSVASLVVGNGALVTLDECTAQGRDGFPPIWPFQPPTSATSPVEVESGGSLWVVNSTLRAGSNATTTLPSVPAISNLSSIPVQVLGASTLAAGAAVSGPGAPCVGPVATALDTLWLGAGAPPNPFPSPTWIDAPVSASIGQPLSIQGTVAPGEFLFLFFAGRSAYVTIPGLRLPVQVDPSTQVLAALMLPGVSSFTFGVPNVSSLVGLETYWQGLVFAAGLDVTNLRSVVIH